ncbi:EAL domain-containing protein [Rhodoferax saidenbachensis]|uniref:Diguanylate cyclase (GGDEF)-like protein n=1 Tax=Rhodoferax saidenbachensis TaxID=1484693 RepID=A0ABU1ZTE2_9BURK|nr:EAL domain-containing protein [Rhodoferax saidenbachensis]MDR7308805.1 diguanylate cyclase (GGDEF)-like protein [Rhodoferax saidenbachensis]
MRASLTKATTAVIGIATFFVLAVAALAIVLVRDSRESALADGKAQAERFVTGAQAAVNRSFLGVDVLLASIDSLLGLQTMQLDWLEAPLANKLIEGATRQNLLVRSVALVDAEGTVVASSDASDTGQAMALPLGFVTEALEQQVSTLLVSNPVVSPSSSEPVLYFARHVRLADGHKLLAVAEVQVNLITAILVQGADISQLEATLERNNGTMLASVPAQESISGTQLQPALGMTSATPEAQEMPSRLSKRPAVVARRGMLYGSLLITASIPLDTVLAEWRSESKMIGGVALTFILVIVVAGVVGLRYLHRMGQAQRAITLAKTTMDQALESMESGFLLLDAQRCVVSWNRRYLEIYPWQRRLIAPGMSFERMLTNTAHELLGDASDDERKTWIASRMDMLSQHLHSHERVLPNGNVIEITERATPDGGVVIVYQDVTRLRQATAEIEQLAFYDPLTGLPNRRLLTDRLQQAITACTRNGRRGALLFMDLDHFKTLNDTLGHDVGDLLLQQVAQRVKACVREADTVARLGGDEFVVMLLDLSLDPLEAAQQAQMVGDNILHSLNQPYLLNGTQYRSSCSVGAALFGDTHQASAELLKQADIAMYQVKNAGRNALCFFDPQMLAAIQNRADLESDLRHALTAQQFELHYQLQTTDQGVPVGAEALVRWRHPQRGLVSPQQFIGLAEDTGLILPLGHWVMQTACAQLTAWQATPDKAALQLSVNVSARQFRQVDFVEQVRGILRDSGANPNLLKLELTESLVLDNVQDTIAKMKQLKATGVRFSMDDFGTGHSSLTYLTQLPLDQLKIDQSFIHNIGVHASDAVIVQTIIGMANTLGLEVIAEGVETEAQRDFLAAHGCHLCQGYLFAKPLPVVEFEAMLLLHEITV